MNIRNVALIFGKEIKSFYSSFVAYAVIAVFLATTGYLFYNLLATFSVLSFQAQANPMIAKQYNLLNLNETVVRPLFGSISMILLLMMPLLTMRLLADEKKTGTMELLLTYPLRDSEIVLGKYLAALTVLLTLLLSSMTYPVLLYLWGEPEVMPIVTGYLGLFLLGAAFIALGIFTSSLTENQIVAASMSMGILFFFWLMSYSVIFVSSDIGRVISYIAINEHLESLAKGVIDTEDIAYYLGFILFFLFLTLRVIESNRWKG